MNALTQCLTHIISVNKQERLKAAKERWTDVLRAQNLTLEADALMKTEHETLVCSIEDLKVGVTETNRLVMSLEG